MKRRSFFQSLISLAAAPIAIGKIAEQAPEAFIAWMPATEIVRIETNIVFYKGRFYCLTAKYGTYGWHLLDKSWHWIDRGPVARMKTCSRCYHDHGHDQWCYVMQRYEETGIL